MSDDFFLRFWGVRGSIACPGPSTVRYGGNTSCVEIRGGDHILVIDGGTGLRLLGDTLFAERRRDVDIFFTHTHWDHVCGVPFFRPAYDEACRVRFWAGHLRPEGQSIRDALSSIMAPPFFPVPIAIFANCEYRNFTCGTPFEPLPGFVVRTAWLNHPNRACGYRVEYGGRSLCVVTDTEHRPGRVDRAVLDLVRGTDIMVYDAMFTDEEYPAYAGWGHSTWQEALRVADEAGVGRAVLFHHDPHRDDAALDRIAEAAHRRRPGTLVAIEGMMLHP
jgi:phosphoribosyl 1,2-cyclic phosphodiesterase